MLKTIKTTKQMRLDELIKYIRDNRVREKTFRTDEHGNALSNALKVDEDGLIETYFPNMHLNNSFTLEVEEPITEDTVIETLVEIQKNEQVNLWFDTNITTYRNADTSKFYALIDGRLELVWERDEE